MASCANCRGPIPFWIYAKRSKFCSQICSNKVAYARKRDGTECLGCKKPMPDAGMTCLLCSRKK